MIDLLSLFTVNANAKNTLQHFQGGGKCPLPCPCLRAPMLKSCSR